MTNPNMAHYDNCLNKIKTLILFLRIDTQEDMYYDLTLSTKTEIASEMLHTMKVPLSPQLLDDLEVFQNNYRSRGSLENRSVQEQALACQIYQNFFPSIIGQICKESVSLLDKQQIETLLLVISSDDKCIINLPFELTLFYFCPSELRHNSFLINRSFGLIRTTCVSVEEFKGESATPKVAPLKMLFIAALPENLEERHKMLQLEAEQEQLIHSIGSLAEHQKPKIVIEFLENASLEELDKALRERQHDIVHISGHGAYESKQNNSILYFEDAFGNVAPVTGKQLGEILQKHLSIKLLMLSACETAWAGEAGSIAQQTALSGALTVIGMRFQISDAAARLFTTCFYTQLANQASVTTALAKARHALYGRESTNTIAEWFTPVVYQNGYIDRWLDPDLDYDLSTFFYQTSRFVPTTHSRFIGNGFIGRKRYLIQLQQAFRNKKQICLYGLGGMGKTTLAEAFAHHYEQGTYSVLIFRDKHEIQEKVILDRLIQWRQTVDLTGNRFNPQLIEDPNYSIEHKLQKVITHCLLGRKTILIFDNFEAVQCSQGALNSKSLSHFLIYLCEHVPDDCHLMFTTRYKILDLQQLLQHIPLTKLSVAEQYRLIHYSPILRLIASKEHKNIYQRLEGHPRAYEYLEALLKKDKGFRLEHIKISENQVWESLLLGKIYQRLLPMEQKGFQIAAIFIAATRLEALEVVWKQANKPKFFDLQHWWKNFLSNKKESSLLRPLSEIIIILQDWGLCVWEDSQQTFEIHRFTRTWMAQYVTSKHNIKLWAYWAALYFEQQPFVSDILFAKDYFEIAQQWEGFLSASDRLTDFYKSIGLYAKAIEINRSMLDKKLGELRTLLILHDIGENLYKLGQYDNALYYWKKTLEIIRYSRKAFNLRLEGTIEFKMGFIQEEKGNYKETLDFYKKALSRFELSKDVKQQYRVQVAIVMIQSIQGIETALKDLEQLSDKQQGIEDWDGQITTLSHIGRIYSEQGNYTAALPYLVQLLEQLTAAKQYIRLAYLMNDIAMFLTTKGYYQIALVYLDKILPIVQSSGDSYCELILLNSISYIYTQRGDYEKAKIYWSQAFAISKESGRADMQKICFNSTATFYLKKGQPELALKHLEYALKIAQKTNHSKDIMNCLYNMGQVHGTQGDFNTALQYLEQALAIAQETHNSVDASAILDAIHEIYKMKDHRTENSQNGDTAPYKAPTSNPKKEIHPFETATMSHSIGAIFVLLGLPEDAIPFLMAAQRLFQQNGEPFKKTEWYLNQIVEQLGKEKYQAILSQLNLSQAAKFEGKV